MKTEPTMERSIRRRKPFLTAALLATMAASFTEAQTMKITRSESRPPQQGPSETFTGDVQVTPLFGGTETLHPSIASVTFQPCARSAWHTHPRGQLLIVTAGAGRVQQWGGPVEEIRAGDTVWTPPGVKHWHGASPETAMTHLAIQEAADGKAVEWMENVTDEQYGAAIDASNR